MLKLKHDEEFIWEEKHQKVFDDIKRYLVSPPVLMPPKEGVPFKLYLSIENNAIGSILVQEFEGKERIIFYLSRRLIDAETRYSQVEKWCLCLYFSCTKLRPYLLNNECIVVCEADVIRYMLLAPILKGRIGKWIFCINEI